MSMSKYPKEIFLDPILPKHYCTYCQSVLQNPYQSSCGHRFCYHCLNEMSSPKCPEDKTSFKREECFPDNFAKRETKQLRVRCLMNKCQWRGQLGSYDDHVSQCSFITITCEECGDKLPREDQHNHVCPKKECMELCSYGCEQKVPHNDLASHQEDVLLHLRELTHRVKELESVPGQAHRVIVKELESVPGQAHRVIVKELESAPQQIIPPAFGDVVKDGGQSTTSELVSLREKVSNMERKLDVDLKTRVHDLESGSVSLATFEELRRKLEQAEARQAQLERERKSQDDVLRQMNTLLPEFDLRLSILESTSYDGTIIWKISNFSRRYEDAASGKTHSLYSQPFFTSHYGYKMCLRLYPYGDGMGKSKHVSLFFVVMKGEYDDILDWPFQRKISFTLLNPEKGRPITDSFIPDPKSSSFKQPTNMMNIASGCPLFAPLNRIWNEGFVKNDCIFVKATVV